MLSVCCFSWTSSVAQFEDAPFTNHTCKLNAFQPLLIGAGTLCQKSGLAVPTTASFAPCTVLPDSSHSNSVHSESDELQGIVAGSAMTAYHSEDCCVEKERLATHEAVGLRSFLGKSKDVSLLLGERSRHSSPPAFWSWNASFASVSLGSLKWRTGVRQSSPGAAELTQAWQKLLKAAWLTSLTEAVSSTTISISGLAFWSLPTIKYKNS